MLDARGEVMQLLNANDSFSWDSAMNLMLTLKWSKRKRIEVLSHSIVFRYADSPYKKRIKLAMKRALIFVLSKRKMRPRYQWHRLLIPMTTNRKKAKMSVCLNTEDDFMMFAVQIIKNNSI